MMEINERSAYTERDDDAGEDQHRSSGMIPEQPIDMGGRVLVWALYAIVIGAVAGILALIVMGVMRLATVLTPGRMASVNRFFNKKVIFLIILTLLTTGLVSLHISWYKTWGNNEHYYPTTEHHVTFCETVLFSTPSDCKQHVITDWCDANGGMWNADARECSGISEFVCSDVIRTDYYDSKCHVPINTYTDHQLDELCSDNQDIDRSPCFFYRFVYGPAIQSVPFNGTLSGIMSGSAPDQLHTSPVG